MENQPIVKFIPAKRWWKLAKWELVKDLTSLNTEVIVPKGFITDGASIPLIARILFSPTGRYFSAAIIHDYIIASAQDWTEANKQIRIEMDKLDIESWRKAIIMFAVILWGKILKLFGKKSISR